MKKIILFAILMIFFLQTVLAINIVVEKESSDEVLIKDLNDPVIFDLRVTNLGASDSFQFYNLLGFSMAPKGTVPIDAGQTENVQLMIFPKPDFNYEGFYTFQYYIRSQDTSEISNKLTFEVFNLEDTLEIGSEEFNPESNLIKIYVRSKVNFNFSELDAKFSSIFFEDEKSFSLSSFEKKEFDIEINKDKLKSLTAGFYTLTAEINLEDKDVVVEGTMKFAEKDILKVTEDNYGFILFTNVVEKKNEGNVVAVSQTEVKKNIISRLFTSFSEEPDSIERRGVNIHYVWDREIRPGKTLRIETKTNWLFPLFVIIFIVAIVILTRMYSRTDLALRKKVNFVKTKGGEFALKVSIFVEARKHVERINVIDRLPALVKVHEKFGSEKPTRINETTRRIEWNIEKLDAGEIRMFSYIIYSKVGVLGKFALPSGTAVYEREGKIKEVESNKAFFIAETRREEINI